MASSGFGNGNGEANDGDKGADSLHQLHKFLECSICLDVYENPKTLQCSHEYCKRCLEDIAVFKDDGPILISCPLRCEKVTSVGSNETVGDLRLASYIVKNILESYWTQHMSSKDSDSPRCVAVENCKKQISLFCCDTMMCVSCHKKHVDEAGVGYQHRQLNLWYDKRAKKLMVLCKEHSTGCTHFCVDNQFLCVYCIHRNTLHFNHSKNKVEVEAGLLRDALFKEMGAQGELELSLARAKQDVQSARKELEFVLAKRKHECLSKYNALLERNELKLLNDFDRITESHLNGYKSCHSSKWYLRLLSKLDIELVVKKESIVDALSQDRRNVTKDLLVLSLSQSSDFCGQHPLGDINHTLRQQSKIPESFIIFTDSKENLEEVLGAEFNFDVKRKIERNGCSSLRDSGDDNSLKRSHTVVHSNFQRSDVNTQSNHNIQGNCGKPLDKSGRKDCDLKTFGSFPVDNSVKNHWRSSPKGSDVEQKASNTFCNNQNETSDVTVGRETEDEGIRNGGKSSSTKSRDSEKNFSCTATKAETKVVRKKTGGLPAMTETDDEGIRNIGNSSRTESSDGEKNNSCTTHTKVETKVVRKKTSILPAKTETGGEGIRNGDRSTRTESSGGEKNDSCTATKAETKVVRKKTGGLPAKTETDDEGIRNIGNSSRTESSDGEKNNSCTTHTKVETKVVRKKTSDLPGTKETKDLGIRNSGTKSSYGEKNDDSVQVEVESKVVEKKKSDELVKLEEEGVLQLHVNGGNELSRNEMLDVLKEIDPHTRAIKACPRDKHFDLSVLYQNRAAVFEKWKRWKNALEDYSHSIQLCQRRHKAYSQRAMVYKELGDKRNAFRDILSCLRIKQPPKETTSALAQRDQLLQALGDESAQNFLRKTRNPALPSVYALKEHFWEYNYDIFGLFDFTKSFLSEEISYAFTISQPLNAADANYFDIIDSIKKGNFENLFTLWEKEVNNDGQHKYRALLMRATFNLLMGEINAALEDLHGVTVLPRTKGNRKLLVDAHLKLARIEFLMGSTKECFDSLQFACDLDKNNASVYYQKGNYLKKQGKVNDAMHSYRKAIELDQYFVSPWIHYLSAWPNEDASGRKKILCQMERGFRDCPRVWRQYGMSIGETRQSLEEMKKAIKLDPDWPTPYVDMAKTYMLLGKNIGAAKIWFQKALSLSVTKAETVEIFKDIERANAEEKIKRSNPNFD